MKKLIVLLAALCLAFAPMLGTYEPIVPIAVPGHEDGDVDFTIVVPVRLSFPVNEEDNLAIRAIWLEARGENLRGKIAVAEVIRNRMQKGWRSDGTVKGTVLRYKQFAGWASTNIQAMDLSDPIVLDCYLAWRTALSGTDFAKGATHFDNLKLGTPYWVSSMQVTAVHGRHTFMKRAE